MLGARNYKQRGLYPRGVITRIKKKSSKESTAVLIKTCFSFCFSLKLSENDIMNRIHFNKIGGGGGVISDGAYKGCFFIRGTVEGLYLGRVIRRGNYER